MKKLICSITIVAIVFLLIVPNAFAGSADVKITGRIVFAVDYKESVMAAKGYHFVETRPNGPYVTNYFGAPSVDIVVKNSKGETIGIGKTAPNGTFEIMAEPSKFFQMLAEFKGRKIDKTFSRSDISSDIEISVGKFDTTAL